MITTSGAERMAGQVVAGMWLLWLVYWWLLSRNTKETSRSETWGSRASYVVLLVAAGYLMSLRRLPISGASIQLYAPRLVLLLVEVACVAAGLGVAVWARRHLGRNWSGTVTAKDDHELIRSGPYRAVRHPIYTGILLALIGMAIGTGTWTSAVAVVLAAVAFLRKLRIEERFMIDQFGDEYERYRREVPALVPKLAG